MWTVDEAPWPALVAGAILVPELISLTAKLLQRGSIGTPVPAELSGIYDPEEYNKSNEYSRTKSTVSLMKDAYDMAVFFTFWFMGGFPWLSEKCEGSNETLTGLAYIGAIFFVGALLDIPWSIYSTFVLEERFGFNNTTPFTFVKDMVKGMLLTVGIGAPLLALILWFFTTFKDYGWLYVFSSVMAFQIVLLFLMPVLILPLFMEMIPLPTGTGIITCELGKESFLKFLSARVFYGGDEHNGRPSWVIRDKRFAGQTNGAVMSVYWKEETWVMAEGSPADNGTVYAYGTNDVLATTGTAEWSLAQATKQMVSDAASKQDNDGKLSKPLIEDKLTSVSVDVGDLRAKLMALADKLGYVGANIYVIDGSTRSSHSNAFCTGFGRFRRICLFDTLLPSLTQHEIVSILGHEIGHDRLFHVHKHLVFSIFYMFIMFYAMGQLMTSSILSAAFFVPEPKVYIGIVLFSFVWGVLEFFVNIPMTVHSRSNEYAADRYSIDAEESYAAGLSSGLTKLMKKSKVNLTPHWFYTFLNESHPPLGIRMKAIEAYKNAKYKR